MINTLLKILYMIVLSLTVCHATATFIKETSLKRVCVIGAGVSGLATARYLKEEGINFTVFEATKYLGGTWRYDPRVGTDENGQPIYTSMYKDLRTNLPKPTMELPGFPLPDDTPSFPSWEVYYNYLKDYAKHFDLEKHIQFLHKVILVTRLNNVWKVRHENIQTHEVFEEEYDYVVVGNGHFSKPNMPNIRGENLFKGNIIHSHDYRESEPYRDHRVLIVGAGPSGYEIGLAVANVSRSLIHSYQLRANFKMEFPENYKRKPSVTELNETGVFFSDGSFEEIDDIIYCTGYQYDYPFLDGTSGLKVTPRYVSPLYKHMVNINQPSMVLIGLINRACLIIVRDAQARYVTALVKGNFTLPSREEMMQDWQRNVDAVNSIYGRLPQPMTQLHAIDKNEDQYFDELSHESGIFRVPPVMAKIRALDTRAKVESLYTYRNYVYTIIDDHTFTRSFCNVAKYM